MDLIDKLQKAFPIHCRKGDILLMQADCMEVMQLIPDKMIDLAIVDPPYGINVNSMNMGGRLTIKPDHREWDNSTPNYEYFLKLKLISNESIIWGGNYFENIWPSRCFIVWDKGESMYGRSFAECEIAYTTFDKSARIFKLTPNDKNRIHTTQKPVKLYKWILTNYAKPDQLIFDSHGGSFSSAIAAHYFGCKFIGCELDADYFQAAVERFKKETAQVDLFCE